jgi:hypothetical protein
VPWPGNADWPPNSSLRDSKEFRAELANVAEGNVRSLLFEFHETKEGELEKGLNAPACEFVCPEFPLANSFCFLLFPHNSQ